MNDKPPAFSFSKFLYKNGLSLVVLVLIILALLGQVFTGWSDYNDALKQMQLAQLSQNQYLGSGHFIEATFENWESEFLQMGLYVLLTVWLRQQGSSESKSLYETEEVDWEPQPG